LPFSIVGDKAGINTWIGMAVLWIARAVSGHVLPESWPGLSRPSTPFSLASKEKKDVDARDKRGHDGGKVIRSHRTL
jgi:hypothetical protein